MTSIRHRVDPLDVPPTKAARRLHLTLQEFRESLPNLISRGFPMPDPTTGNYYLPAIDAWMASRGNSATCQSTSITDVDMILKQRLERLERL